MRAIFCVFATCLTTAGYARRAQTSLHYFRSHGAASIHQGNNRVAAELKKHFVQKLYATMEQAKLGSWQLNSTTVRTVEPEGPKVQTEVAFVTKRVKAMLKNQTFQDHAMRLAQEIEAMLADQNFQKRAQFLVEQQETMITEHNPGKRPLRLKVSTRAYTNYTTPSLAQMAQSAALLPSVPRKFRRRIRFSYRPALALNSAAFTGQRIPGVLRMSSPRMTTSDDITPSKEGPAASSVRKYFDAWNQRDMETACNCFAGDCRYEDTQYAGAFVGKAALKQHLIRVADALPPSFAFCIDDIADAGETVGVQWHVENDGQPLPFTRGCSMYRADPSTGLLVSGFDVPEPAPFKPGSASLSLLSLASKLLAEPLRAVPLVLWGLYVWIVFFSNGILPGPDATQLDGDTWEEVLGLSLNFWLIAPLLKLPFSPVLHPTLEGMFNLLLAWAAAFVGFLSDGRPGRASGSMVPTVAGMQLLTNAVLLPYLVTRTPEKDVKVFYEDLDPKEAVVSEWRGLGPLLGAVGTGSLLWGSLARPEFGDLATRWASFVELLSGDRLGSSFVVDLVLFALFQGWLVDDDLKRRGLAEQTGAPSLRVLAKYVPFYGLCAYLAARPALPRRADAEEHQ